MKVVPFFLSILTFALGTFTVCCLPQLPNLSAIHLIALILLPLFFLLQQRLGRFILILAYLTGCAWSYDQASQALTNRLPLALENMPLIARGEILSIPEASDMSTHFEFKIDALYQPSDCQIHNNQYQCRAYQNRPWHLPQKVRLNWYHNQHLLHLGDEWFFSIKLKSARSTFNPASFDYEAWLMSHHISAVGYVVEKYPVQLVTTHTWHRGLDQVRQIIQEKMNQTLTNNLYQGMVEALAIGIRNQITSEQWQTMQATGINHLMAIAGLHLGFVVSFVYYLSKKIISINVRLLLWRPAPEIALMIALIAGVLYSALAGFSLPTQRALIMMSVALSTQLLRRQISPWQGYWLALLAVLVYDPLSILAESFWLSFIAVGVILFAILGRLKFAKFFHLSYLQWVIFLGLMPITLLFFHQISLINFLANCIAIPWVALITLPCTLLGILTIPVSMTMSHLLWLIAAQSLRWLWPIIQWLASLDKLHWHCYINQPFQLLLAMIGILLLLAPKGWPQKYLGIFGFFPLLFYQSSPLATGTFKLSLLDVGQGLSAIVQTAHHTLVYDTGLRLDDSYDMGQSVVVPALQQMRVPAVDLMIISHRDNDHSGGSMAVLKNIPVKQILTSAPELYNALPNKLPMHITNQKIHRAWLLWPTQHLQKQWPKPQITNCVAGQHWRWDNVQFTILNPASDYFPNKNNDRSCVLMVDNGTQRLLLTGDIEKHTETKLLADYPLTALQSNVIIAPHHGSKTSSSEAFVAAVKPQWVFYPLGYLNKFHFPSPLVTSRYQAINAHAMDTANAGQIQALFLTDQQPIQVFATRKTLHHFWNF